jgi:hypothetical protein
MMDTTDERRLHSVIGMVGLRAHATAVGLIQLTTELRSAGVIDEDALTRIKDAIAKDIALSRPMSQPKEEYEAAVHRRLDALFSGTEKVGGSVPLPHKTSSEG